MKYYATVGSITDIEAATVIPPNCILASYHYFKKKPELITACLQQNFDVFIDSGAFSASTKDAEIDIDKYCEFLLATGAVTYAGLDVIGDAKKTYENIKYMESEYNLKPIPTFHVGSTIEDLEKIIHYPYIALGGLVLTEGIRRHLYKVWNFILNNNPKIRVHGFGTTNIDLMYEYPWYSVDSSSYKWCKRFGDQYILYNGFEMQGIRETEYLDILEKSGYKGVKEYSKKDQHFLYDFHSCQSYKLYAAHLTELNKFRKFENLTAQNALF